MEGYLAEIRGFAGHFAPRNWMFCNGAILSISEYMALYSLIGTQYGGDGRVSFGVPDLRGRVPVGAGKGPGLHTYIEGQMAGHEVVYLSIAQLPTHDHKASMASDSVQVEGSVSATMGVGAEEAEANAPSGNYLGFASAEVYVEKTSNGDTLNPEAIKVDTSQLHVHIPQEAIQVATAGGSEYVDVRQPFQAINWIICTEGLYPSRS